MDKINTIPSGIYLQQNAVENGRGLFNRAKLAIMTILVINLLYPIFLMIEGSALYNSGHYMTFFVCYQILYLAVWGLGCWQFIRMPQKSFKMCGWFMGAYTIFNIISVRIAPLIDQSIYDTALAYCGEPILNAIGFFILLLGLLAVCWNDGINYAAVSLIVSLNIINVGMLFAIRLPFGIVGSFANEMSWISILVNICITWAWWMFFKYTSPETECNSANPSLKALICNRVFIGVAIVMTLMIPTLFFITKAILNS